MAVTLNTGFMEISPVVL